MENLKKQMMLTRFLRLLVSKCVKVIMNNSKKLQMYNATNTFGKNDDMMVNSHFIHTYKKIT